MKVLIEAPFDLTDKSKMRIENKISKLEKFNSNITRAEVYFKTDDGKEPGSVLAEVQLHVPGPVIFASENGENFKTAFSGAVRKAKKQLRKNKQIRQTHTNSTKYSA